MKGSFLILIAFFCFTGCGNKGETTLVVLPAAATSYFGGTWSGTWYTSAGNQTCTASLIIDKDGNATGSLYNPTSGEQASLSGAVSSDGAGDFTYVYPTATFTAKCTLNKDSAGHLLGNCDEYSQDSLTGTVLFDFAKQK